MPWSESEANAYTDGHPPDPVVPEAMGRHDVEGEDRGDQRRRAGHHQPEDGELVPIETCEPILSEKDYVPARPVVARE